MRTSLPGVLPLRPSPDRTYSVPETHGSWAVCGQPCRVCDRGGKYGFPWYGPSLLVYAPVGSPPLLLLPCTQSLGLAGHECRSCVPFGSGRYAPLDISLPPTRTPWDLPRDVTRLNTGGSSVQLHNSGSWSLTWVVSRDPSGR